MNKIAILGIGNCGSQIANLAEQKYPELFEFIYMNSSESDLSMVKSENSLKIKIGDPKKVEGSGKNRDKMKDFLKNEIVGILMEDRLKEIMTTCKYCFICSSTAGGTGSGSAPIMMEFLRSVYPACHFILVGVLPKYQASMLELGNTMEYLKEIYGVLDTDTRITYMIYDNDTVSDLPSTSGLSKVNECIVEDIRVLTGIDCFPTPFDSIDDADMESMITTPGRLLVARIPSDPKDASILSEKNMEDNDLGSEIVRAIKRSHHTEIDRDRSIPRRGVITYLTPQVNSLYNSEMQKLDEFLGTPVERFEHNAINDGKENMNFIYVIASGLSPINDRSAKIKQRIEELQQALPKQGQYALTEEDVSTLGLRHQIDDSARKANAVVPEDIFKKFGK